MKSTGIVRPVDRLGRIVLPIELRRMLGIGENDLMEIYTEDNTVVLKKYENKCIFCGSNDQLSEYMGKSVCAACAAQLNR